MSESDFEISSVTSCCVLHCMHETDLPEIPKYTISGKNFHCIIVARYYYLTPAAVVDAWDRVISGVCDSVCVRLSAL